MINLRTPNLMDMCRHSEWAQRPEVAALDPPAGMVDSPLFWAIYLSHKHIGSISIYNRIGTTAELGILIGESTDWSKGYGTEAIKRVLSMCKQAGFTEIHLKVLPSNTRAIHCYEKCGFRGVSYFGLSGNLFLQMSIDIDKEVDQGSHGKP